MPDSSIKTISRPSLWAFFKGRPLAAFPAAHNILVALNGPFFGLLRGKAKRAQDAPDLGLAEMHAMHALDNDTDSFECPQLSAKAVLGWILQNGTAQFFELRLIESGRTAPQRHCAQGINSALLEKRFPCVYGLPRHAHIQRNFSWRHALLQKSPRTNPLLRCLVHCLFGHASYLQTTRWRYNAWHHDRLS
jgi:hypothetical protein